MDWDQAQLGVEATEGQSEKREGYQQNAQTSETVQSCSSSTLTNHYRYGRKNMPGSEDQSPHW